MAKRYVCIGRRECGKSYWARVLVRRLLADGAHRALVWVRQPEAVYDGPELHTLAAAAEHPDAPVWVFRPPVAFAEVCGLVKTLRTLRPTEELVLVIDEVADPEVSTGGTYPDWACASMRELTQTIRGVHIVCTTQTPSGIPLPLRDLADRYYLFTITGAGALRRLENDGVPPEKLARLPLLPERVFLETKPGKW